MFAAEIKTIGNQPRVAKRVGSPRAPTRVRLLSRCASEPRRSGVADRFVMFFPAQSNHQLQKPSSPSPAFRRSTSLQGSSLCKALLLALVLLSKRWLLSKPNDGVLWNLPLSFNHGQVVCAGVQASFATDDRGLFLKGLRGGREGRWGFVFSKSWKSGSGRCGQVGLELLVQRSVE